MAIQTQRLAAFEDKAVVLSFDWDDETGRIIRVRSTATPTYGAFARIEGDGGSVEWSCESGSGETVIDLDDGPVYEVVPGPRGLLLIGWSASAGTSR